MCILQFQQQARWWYGDVWSQIIIVMKIINVEYLRPHAWMFMLFLYQNDKNPATQSGAYFSFPKDIYQSISSILANA